MPRNVHWVIYYLVYYSITFIKLYTIQLLLSIFKNIISMFIDNIALIIKSMIIGCVHGEMNLIIQPEVFTEM